MTETEVCSVTALPDPATDPAGYVLAVVAMRERREPGMTATVLDRADDLLGQATAEFSADRVYRYALTRTWDSQRLPLVLVMLNPSTADAFTVDPTVRRCLAFARRWGAGGLIVLNLYGLRSTDPRALRDHPDPVGPDNDTAITAHLANLAAPVARVPDLPAVQVSGSPVGAVRRDPSVAW